MKLLKDLVVYVIKVDYFMEDENGNEYTKPMFLFLNSLKSFYFKEEIEENIRIFYSHKEAVQYIAEHSALRTPCYGENVRVVKIKYNFKENKWEEITNEK